MAVGTYYNPKFQIDQKPGAISINAGFVDFSVGKNETAIITPAPKLAGTIDATTSVSVQGSSAGDSFGLYSQK